MQSVRPTVEDVILSFRNRGLELLHRTGSTRGVQVQHAKKLKRILAALGAASTPKDLDLPGYRLHRLKGRWRGHWSVWVRGNRRVTFRFVGNDVESVDYVDYH